MWDAIARFASRYAVLVIGLWFIAAGAGNFFVPQVETTAGAHARGFLPEDAPANIAGARMGEQFGDGDGSNLNYLVLESDQPLGQSEQTFHNKLIATLRADSVHVESVMDLWSDPLTRQGALSADGHAAFTMLRLTGELGAAQANESLAAVRKIVAEQPAPLGLSTYITGPGATIADELSAIDSQMILITVVTVILIALLLFAVYRSVVTALIPLLTVGLGLGVARSIVSFLGERNLMEVSVFSVSLLGAMVLGAATDYGIFLLGRYHEARREGLEHEQALQLSNQSVAPVILASGLTVAAALSCLAFAEVGMLRSAGLPCAIGILTGMLASITLLPALIGIAGRYGFAQPRKISGQVGSRWRRVGTMVVRWPVPVLMASALMLLICALPATGLKLGFDELASQPESTQANRGYQAMDRHFPANQLLPEIVSIETDHDLRNPAGIIAIERVSRKLMETPGITMVQSASRPAGSVPEESTFTNQAGRIGDQLNDGITTLAQRLSSVNQLAPTLDQFALAIAELQEAFSVGANGLDGLSSGASATSQGMQELQENLSQVSGYLDPLRDLTKNNPSCRSDQVCSLVLTIVEPVDSAVASTSLLAAGASQLGDGATDISEVFASAEQSIATMGTAVGQLNLLTTQLTNTVGDTSAMFSELTEYLRGVREAFQGSGEGGYYLPQQAWQDSRFQRAAGLYFAPEGKVARILVYGNGKVFGIDGAQRSPQITEAVKEATKEGTLAGSIVNINGFGTGTAQLRGYVDNDFRLLALVALTLVFLIVLVMLRSLIAAMVVIGTVIISYLSALGISTLLWQDLLGKDLHWSVPSIALIALVAVGADYNLLLTMRMREESFVQGISKVGLRTAMIRTFGGTGGVVTTAGIVFGITMFAMLSSDVLSIEQVGTTIGAGLIIDTLIVRTFVVPAIAGLLGKWFWWSPPVSLLGSLLKGTRR
ncbi:MAG: RND family transporter [Mycobacteriaceae bacterium]